MVPSQGASRGTLSIRDEDILQVEDKPPKKILTTVIRTMEDDFNGWQVYVQQNEYDRRANLGDMQKNTMATHGALCVLQLREGNFGMVRISDEKSGKCRLHTRC